MRKPPPVSPKLVKWLEEVHPDTLPTRPLGNFELGRKVGQQDIIRKLRKVSKSGNILESS